MLSGRIFRFVFLAAMMLATWGYLDHVQSDLGQYRSDLLTRTRFLIRQSQTADAETRERLSVRYRVPDGELDRQKLQFEQIWSVLRACEPRTVVYADDLPSQNGRSPSRRVVIRGRDAQGRPSRVNLEWVRINDTWYIEACGAEKRG